MVAEVVIAASGARLVRYIDEIRVSKYNNEWHTSDKCLGNIGRTGKICTLKRDIPGK